MKVKWTDSWREEVGSKWIDHSEVRLGEVVGYLSDYYNRPCAVVKRGSGLELVQLDELEVVEED